MNVMSYEKERVKPKINCMIYRFDLIDYAKAWDIQNNIWSQKINGRTDDVLLLLSHPPTFTIGKSGKTDNLLRPRDELEKQGISLYFIDRGGDITYHGPGQLVAYPIMDLRKYGKDIHYYVHGLEEVIIRTLADLSIKAHRDSKHIGVWVGDEKIAAIGIRVKRWITMHGLALNIDPSLEHFSFINPCGIADKDVTSIKKVLGHDVSMDTVAESLTQHFSAVFDTSLEWGDSSKLIKD